MGRLLRTAILVVLIFTARSAFGGTFYVAANGSDSNNGTSKSTPWLHAPGMTGCASNCASHTPVAGDSFILRGGDTWHTSGGTVGLPWTWNWSGSGTTSNPGCVGSGCIYVGVDQTWFAGGSWTRPILNGDNPLSTSVVGSCTHGNSLFVTNNGSYVIFDNFEELGGCSVDTNGATFNVTNCGTQSDKWENFYIHGWTYTGTSGQRVFAFNGNSGGCLPYPKTNNEWGYNVFDGSDSSPQSLTILYGDCYSFHHNYMSHVANFVCNNAHMLNDNVFEYFNESLNGSDHGNVMELNRESNEKNYFYNNLVRHIGNLSTIGVNWWIAPTTGTYLFNNIFYDIKSSGNYFNNTAGGGPAYFYNNTFVIGSTGGGIENPTDAYNNHWVSDGSVYLENPTNSGNNLPQTNAQATAAGYTVSNQYAPTSASSPTVGIGRNNTTSGIGGGGCGGVSDSTARTACLSDTTLGVGYNTSNHTVVSPARTPNARPSSGAWDAEAFQYSTTQASAPNPPTGLTVAIQ